MKRFIPILFTILLFSCTEEEATFQSCVTQFPIYEYKDDLAPFKEARTGNALLQKDADFLLEKLGLEKGQTLIPFAKLILGEEQGFPLLLFENKDKATILASFDKAETLIDNSSLPSNAQFQGQTKLKSAPMPYLEFTLEKPRLNDDYKEEIPAIYTQKVNLSPEGKINVEEAVFSGKKSIPLLRKNNPYSGKFTYKRPKVLIELLLRDGKDKNAYAYDLFIKTYNGCRQSFIGYRGISLNTDNEMFLQGNSLLSIKMLDKNSVELNNRSFIKNCEDDWPFTIKLRRDGTWRYTENEDGTWSFEEEKK